SPRGRRGGHRKRRSAPTAPPGPPACSPAAARPEKAPPQPPTAPGSSSWADWLISLGPKNQAERLGLLDDDQLAALYYDWNIWGRKSQIAPPGDWRVWLLLAGRGFGKTRSGAEWARQQV